MSKRKSQIKDGVFLRNGVLRSLLSILLVALCSTLMLTGCTTAKPDPFEARLAAMSDEDLISYYRGINDRLKEIQAETRATDRQGAILQDDHIAQMPYIIGGEAWRLEQKRTKVNKALNRRHITP